MIEKLTPVLPAGHKWRKDYVLQANPGTHRSRTYSGFASLPDARKNALALVKEGSAKEVCINRYSEGCVSIRPHVVEIITKDAA